MCTECHVIAKAHAQKFTLIMTHGPSQHRYLDLLQRKLEAKAHALTRGKRQPGTCPAPLIIHPPVNTGAQVTSCKDIAGPDMA